MPITVTTSAMKYKNPDTGIYQGVNMLEEATIRDTVTAPYDPTSSYSVGEHCLNNGYMYICNTAIPAGGEAWNSNHWDQRTVAGELEDLQGAINGLGSDDIDNDSTVTGTSVSDALETLDTTLSQNLVFPNHVKALTSSDDLNDLYNEADSGWYSLGNNVQNAPESWCRMLVIGGSGCSQVVFTATFIYVRMYTGSPLAWLAWRKILPSETVDDKILTVSTAFSIPAQGSSTTKNITGMTADHILVAWNFSDSAENDPPVSLTWTTASGSFTVTNNHGATSETIKPVFIKPTAK